MNNIFNQIYNKIKKYNKIVIARHVGADPDALGSTLGLKEAILNTFPPIINIGIKIINAIIALITLCFILSSNSITYI